MYTKLPMELNLKTGEGVTPYKVSTVPYKKCLGYKHSEGRHDMYSSINNIIHKFLTSARIQ